VKYEERPSAEWYKEDWEVFNKTWMPDRFMYLQKV
jgi:hypothetical protein